MFTVYLFPSKIHQGKKYQKERLPQDFRVVMIVLNLVIVINVILTSH